jgi:hypothetical protein
VHNASVGATIFQKLPTRQTQFLCSCLESPRSRGSRGKMSQETIQIPVWLVWQNLTEIDSISREIRQKLTVKSSIQEETGQNCCISETTHPPGSHWNMIYCRLAAWLYSQRRKYMTSKQGQQAPETFRHLLVCVTSCSCHYSIHFSWHMLAGHAPRIKVLLTCVVCRAKLFVSTLIDYICL